MYTIYEGEIILKEKYGSTSREILYVKPPEQRNIVILDEEKLSDIASWFTRVFLPQGYPDSVSKDYIAYQIWDTAQAFCSTITGTLATQEVLRGVGVGETGATPLAATVTWVIKDGCGHLGRILFAFSHGTYLDAYSKKWRLYADTLNDAAMCIEIALPLFKNYTTFALCVSTVMKAIVGVAGGATRAAMTQHHAVRGNLADVSAKDSAQETAVNLVASFTALLIITIFGNSLIIFVMMMVLHIIFNYMAVRAVCLRTLNEPRFLQVIDIYIKQEVISNPCEINRNEPIVFYQLGPNLLDLKLCGFKIRLGRSIKKIVSRNTKATHLRKIIEIYEDRQYLLIPNISDREMYVLIKATANTDDILCAYFHAVILSAITCAINDYPLSLYQDNENTRPFAQVCHTLQSAEWSREATECADSFSGFQYEPSNDLINYVDKIVQKEWFRIKIGLAQTGWDLGKHLLIVDEWRVSNKEIVTDAIPMDKSLFADSVLNTSSRIIPFGDTLDELDYDENTDKNEFLIEPESSISKLHEIPILKKISQHETQQQLTSNETQTVESNTEVAIKKD